MPAGTEFSFNISARGNYIIDWGDGEIEIKNKTNTEIETYSHAYDNGGIFVIGISGDAISYNSSDYVSAISFTGNKNIAQLSGDLGKIFVGGAKKYMFNDTFGDCVNLTQISSDLFKGVSGNADSLFNSTFDGCSALQNIPENLFQNISGSASDMFRDTFRNCSALTAIPDFLFKTISGGSYGLFADTFRDCKSLKTIKLSNSLPSSTILILNDK